jgi:hypothetical protein
MTKVPTLVEKSDCHQVDGRSYRMSEYLVLDRPTEAVDGITRGRGK